MKARFKAAVAQVSTLQAVPSQTVPLTQQRCVSDQGFSLHAEVRCAAHQRHKLESQGQGLVRAPVEDWPGPKVALLGAPRTQHSAHRAPRRRH